MRSFSEGRREASKEAFAPISQYDLEQIHRWNSNCPENVEACVHDLILQKAQQQASKVSICSWDGELTYQELENLSSKLAVHIRRLGVRQRRVIPFSFEKSKWAVIAMMAILKAGGAFVAIDPAHPRERIQSILDDICADLIICAPSYASLFQDIVPKVVSLAETHQLFSEELELHDVDVTSRDTACVLYTSGSTGRPKGIVLSHSALSTMAKTHADALHVGAESRVFQFAAYTFDVSVMDIFTTLYSGGCVCIPSETDRKNDIAGSMNKLHVNWAGLTPTVASLLVPDELSSLKTLVLAGEEVTQELVVRWSERVRMLNCYGPAESAACTAYEYPNRHASGRCIGRAMPGARCWIVDADNHDLLVPIGAIGELVVEGNTLANGYLNNPTTTQAVFVRDPAWYKIGPSCRFYKTGDLAYYDSDGLIVFVGRKDLQVKIRGQRVDLGGIENFLSTNSRITQNVVAFPRDGPFAKKLVAVVQLKHEGNLPWSDETVFEHFEADGVSSKAFARYAEQALPSYMVPEIWLFIRGMPMSASAKIDRKRISAWLESAEHHPLGQDFQNTAKNLPCIHSNDKLSLGIGARVAEVVTHGNAAAISILKDRNFELARMGINSIQVMTLSTLLHREFGVRIGVEKLLRNGLTIQDLAEEVRGNDSSSVETIVTRVDIQHEVDMFREELSGWKFNTITISQSPWNSITVFLTGATGFLGTHILKLLVGCSRITKILLHVRAEDKEKALNRIIASARRARWWHNCFLPKLECWIGDLGLARIGLTDSQWARLSGQSSKKIDIIIHNGAAVRWNVDYESLEPENVGSTKELLKAVAQGSHQRNFVYISGGQKKMSSGEDDDENDLSQSLASTGYSQTKLVSETIVKEFARHEQGRYHQISVIKPGYIIGTPEDGIADTDDYIWRLAAGALEIQGYDESDANSWLFIADVEKVASVVLDLVLPFTISSPRVAKILDGMTMGAFWKIFEECGYSMLPLKRQEWLNSLRKCVEMRGEEHPLWPVLYMLEDGDECLSSGQEMIMDRSDVDERRVEAAIRRNIKHLQSIGFLPQPRRSGDLKEKPFPPKAGAIEFTSRSTLWTIERNGDLSKLVGFFIRALFPLVYAPPIVLIMHLLRRLWI